MIDEHIQNLIDLKNGDDHGELYLMPDGHFSHPVEFDAFSLEDVKERAARYEPLGVDADTLKEDVALLSAHKGDIAHLFYRPDNFIHGGELGFRTRMLMERAFLVAAQQRNGELQDALIDVLDGCYQNIDSLTLQDCILFAMEDKGEEALFPGDQRHRILKFFYDFNTVALDDKYDEEHFCYRTNNQKRLFRALYAYAEKENEISDYTKFGDFYYDFAKMFDMEAYDICKQISLESLYVLLYLPDFILSKICNEEQMKDCKYNERDCFAALSYYFLWGFSLRAPQSLNYLDICMRRTQNQLQSIDLENPVYIRYYLFALRRWAAEADNRLPFDVTAVLDKIIALLGGSADRPPEGFSDTANRLTTGASELLKNIVSGEEDWQLDEIAPDMQRLGQALEIEMLYSAFALTLHEKYEQTDLWAFLRRLQFVFVYDENAVLVVADENAPTASAYRIPIEPEWRMAAVLGRFVEGLYNSGASEEFYSYGQSVITALNKVRRA